jgi:exosortase/archaeosortase family protein
MIRRALLFAALFAVPQLIWQALRGTAVERALVHDGTVRCAVFLINLLTPQVHASAVGATVSAPGGGVRIVNGCDGTEAWFLLFAAFAVAPLGWNSRCRGFLLGTAVVFTVNQLRILALFYTIRADRGLFDLLHSTVTPIAVILLVAGYFYAWVAHDTPRAATAV